MNITWGLLSKYKAELYGFSIIWIVLFHGLVLVKAKLPKFLSVFTNFIKHGNCGVEIFLFLSGICLYYSYINNRDVLKFYERRLKRVLPPFFVIDGIYWLYKFVWLKNDFLSFFKNITLYSFWVEYNQQVWFVALILILYILYPYIFKLIFDNKKGRSFELAALLCLLIYLGLFLLQLIFPSYVRGVEIALTRIPVFILGTYCGALVYENKPLSKRELYLFCFFALIGVFGYFNKHFLPLVKCFRIAYLFIGPSLTIVLCIILEKFQISILNSFLAWFGSFSLELYLVHITLRQLCSSFMVFGKNPYFNYLLYFGICFIGASVISFVVNRSLKRII